MPFKNFAQSAIDSSQIWAMFLSAIVTAKTSGFNLAPLHVGQGVSRIYASYLIRL